MATPPARALSLWRRRIRWALAVGGAADGIGGTALAGACALLVLRTFGSAPAPSAWWGIALVVPAVWAAVRVRRRAPSEADAALHLDRRLHLSGLLLSERECDASAWSERLAQGLRDLGPALPRLRGGRAALRAALPLAVLGGVLLLPAPAVDPAKRSPAIEGALERFERSVREIAEAGGLREEAREEIAERTAELERREERGEPVEWADVDGLEERLDHEVARRGADLARARSELLSLASEEAAGADGARDRMAALVEDAERLGLLEGAAKGLAESAGLDDPSAAAGDATLAGDARALAELAKALSATAGERLDALAKLGSIDPADLAALDRLLAEDPLALDRAGLCEACRGERPEGCGG